MPFKQAATEKFRSMVQRMKLEPLLNSPKKIITKKAGESVSSSYKFSSSSGTDHMDKDPDSKRLLNYVTNSFNLDHFSAALEKAAHHKYYPPNYYYNSIPFDKRWDSLQQNLAVLGRISTGNTVIAFNNSADAFQSMWDAVDGAEQEVLWQTYICKDDEIGKATLEKLEDAKRRGCHTELLYDCGGNISGRSRLIGNLKQLGGNVIRYRPFFANIIRYFAQGMNWKVSPGLRNHRKILLVDQRVGFCGGLNIGNEYCGEKLGGTGKFRDSHCMVLGPAVQHLMEVYNDTKKPQKWKYSLARWRQIAQAKIHRKYDLGVNAMDQYFLRPIQSGAEKVTDHGRLYLRNRSADRLDKDRAPTLTAACKPRWLRQREKIVKLVAWYQNRSAKHHKNADFIDGDPKDTPKSTDTFSSIEKNKHSILTKRKNSEERIKALYEATDISSKRFYTQILLQSPISDTDPIPESEIYSRLRPETTQILCCNPGYRDWSIQYALWQITRKAHRRLWITTPYYLPHRKLTRALVRAAQRGVDVRILSGSNATTDPWFMWHASNYITEKLIRAGVKIYEYKGKGVMHAKTVVVDSIWSSIGSYNWDVMSNKNLEVCVCHLSHSFARDMEEHFLEDLAKAEQIHLDAFLKRSLWRRFASAFFYYGVLLMDKITFRSFEDADISHLDPSDIN